MDSAEDVQRRGHFEWTDCLKMSPFKRKLSLVCVMVLFAGQCALNLLFFMNRGASFYILPTTSQNSSDNRVLSPKLMSRGVFEGYLRVRFSSMSSDANNTHPELSPGGSWHPTNCTARQRVAIIIPYRDRRNHLRILLNHLHPFLQRQLLDYTIFVVEQDNGAPFNRGMLMNIGFREANLGADYDCFIFHDVDLLPENDRNIYDCADQPRHMSAAVDTLRYKLPYPDIFGGVTAIKKEHFEMANGFSNKFFGWGGEDDDLFNRFDFLQGGILRYDREGLNSLIYDRRVLDRRKLYTLISVEIDEMSVLSKLRSASSLANEANLTSPYLASRRRAKQMKYRRRRVYGSDRTMLKDH